MDSEPPDTSFIWISIQTLGNASSFVSMWPDWAWTFLFLKIYFFESTVKSLLIRPVFTYCFMTLRTDASPSSMNSTISFIGKWIFLFKWMISRRFSKLTEPLYFCFKKVYDPFLWSSRTFYWFKWCLNSFYEKLNSTLGNYFDASVSKIYSLQASLDMSEVVFDDVFDNLFPSCGICYGSCICFIM